MGRLFKKEVEQTGRTQQNESAVVAQYLSKNKPLFDEVRRAIDKAPSGFKLDDTPLGTLLGTQNPIIFKLKSGAEEQFKYEYIEHADLMTATDVVDDTNGRNQSNLTEENLAPITQTFKVQQFYPAIGFRRKDGVIEIVDGSRRRMAAHMVGRGLIILVCENELSRADAQQLAKDLQTAVEHNLKERGKRWIRLSESMNSKEIAEYECVSESTVSRGLKAGQVSDEMTMFINDENHLTTQNWITLYDIEHAVLPELKMTVAEFVELVKVDLDKNAIEIEDAVMYDRQLVDRMKKLSKATPAKKTDKPITKTIRKYSAQVSLRTKINKDRFSVETGKINQAAQKEIEKAVEEILNKHYAK